MSRMAGLPPFQDPIVREGDSKPRVLLAHDWLCGYRGGEAVLERLARLVETHFQPAGLLVMFDDRKDMEDTPTINSWRRRGLIHASSLSDMPGAMALRRWMLAAYPLAIRELGGKLAELHRGERIDLVVSTSSSAIKGLRTPMRDDGGGRVAHVCYCFAPARYLWSQAEAYGRGGSLSAVSRRLALRAMGPPLRAWDRRTSANVTRFVGISRHIVREIERCYGRSADLVHPPTRTGFFTPLDLGAGGRDAALPGGIEPGYWLYVGALEPYKRADLAIEAARAAGARLVIAGAGSELASIRARAGEGVRVLGRVTNEVLRALYRHARFLVFPQVEDYGIVAVEALACGCPVLARGAGGALDIIDSAEIGAMFEVEDVGAIVEASARVAGRPGCEAACRARAELLDEAAFDARMLAVVRSMV